MIVVNDGLDFKKLKRDLETNFPDVNIMLRHGMNNETSVLGDTDDIYLPLSPTLAPEVEASLLDLSAFESTSNYYTTALAGCASINNSKQYLLPMPCNIRGMVYNKTLFEENGWKVPHSKSEFVELCHTIDASGVAKRSAMMYINRTAAMTIETQNASLYALDSGSSGEFAMMPFYSGDEPGGRLCAGKPHGLFGSKREGGPEGQ